MSKDLQALPATKGIKIQPFRVIREPLGDKGIVITVTGELDMLTVPDLHDALDEALAAGMRRIVLDFLHVTFIDSVSLAAIVSAKRRMGLGGRMAVVLERDSYSTLIFEIGGMDAVVEVCHTREEVLARYGG